MIIRKTPETGSREIGPRLHVVPSYIGAFGAAGRYERDGTGGLHWKNLCSVQGRQATDPSNLAVCPAIHGEQFPQLYHEHSTEDVRVYLRQTLRG